MGKMMKAKVLFITLSGAVVGNFISLYFNNGDLIDCIQRIYWEFSGIVTYLIIEKVMSNE